MRCRAFHVTRSRGSSIIIVQRSAQAFAALNLTGVCEVVRFRLNRAVTQSLPLRRRFNAMPLQNVSGCAAREHVPQID